MGSPSRPPVKKRLVHSRDSDTCNSYTGFPRSGLRPRIDEIQATVTRIEQPIDATQAAVARIEQHLYAEIEAWKESWLFRVWRFFQKAK